MTYRIEVDAHGRIGLPLELQEALKLSPGSAVEIRCEAEAASASLIAAPPAPAEPFLIWVDGMPMIEGLPPETAEETVAAIRQMREDRIDRVSHFSDESVVEAA